MAGQISGPKEYSAMDRKIETLLPGQRVIDDADMLLYRGQPTPDRVSIGPFVFPRSRPP